MKLAQLDTRRPDVDLDLLADLWALYRGGKDFHARIERFLPKRPAEPDDLYAHRKKVAHYLNYAGPIVNFFLATLFSDEAEVTAKPDPSAFYAEFLDDCDGLGTDLHVLLKDRTTRACVERRSWLLVDFPSDGGAPPADAAEWEQRGLGRAYLCALNDADVLDWEVDERGELEWAIVKQRDARRRSPELGRDTITDTWTIWTRTEWRRFAVTYPRDKPPMPEDLIPEVARGPVATEGRVPLVRIEVPDELWIMSLLADPQVEQMRARNAESWSLARTCYAMRVFKSADPTRPPVHGPGFGMVIAPEESVEWDAPPADAFAPVADYGARTKDELYRVAHQMALGVENNAAAVGRSAESKSADHAATVVVVKALARIVRETTKRILDLVSLGRRETHVWTVGGMDSYDAQDAGALAEMVATVETLAIPSPTFRRLLARRLALASVPDATPEEREAISKEIETNITDESVVARAKVDNETPDQNSEPDDDDTEQPEDDER